MTKEELEKENETLRKNIENLKNENEALRKIIFKKKENSLCLSDSQIVIQGVDLTQITNHDIDLTQIVKQGN